MTIRHKPGIGLHHNSAEWHETIANSSLFGGDGETASGPASATDNGSGPVTPPGGDDTATAVPGGTEGGPPPDEFTRAALRVLDAGCHPLPIGRQVNGKPPGKVPWLKGLTGYDGADAEPEQVEKWPAKVERMRREGIAGILNLGMRFPVGGVGIDVDAYDGKRGQETIAELEARLGPLPPTFRVTARPYEQGSGIRLYRVRTDLVCRTELKSADGSDGHVEILQRHHRLAALPPSIHHTGARYRIYDERTGREVTDLPVFGTWPELPDAWQDYLASEAKAGGRKATPEEVVRFAEEHTSDAHPELLAAVVRPIREARTDTYKVLRDGLCQAARESRGGWYPWSRAISEIGSAATESYEARGRTLDPDEFARLQAYAVAKANAEPLPELVARLDDRVAAASGFASAETKSLADKSLSQGGFWYEFCAANFGGGGWREHFKVLGPQEWAAPVPDQEFLIAGVLCRDTFGPNAGPKKSLKTHENQGIAFAVATGQNLYLDARFPVRRRGKVLYIVGEGGEVPVRRTMHRMARAYGLDLAEVLKDPSFPLVAVFGAKPLNGLLFKAMLAEMLDEHQPDLVLLESFYNFHPTDVETANLYQRGQVIDEYHKSVREMCDGAVSLLTDHFRSTGVGKSVDLDNISMSGQAENADSWILRNHARNPDVPNGEFWLRTDFGSRQWGGAEWLVNWHLGAFDHERGCHLGDISWDVGEPEHRSDPAGDGGSDLEQRIIGLVAMNPWRCSKRVAAKMVGGQYAKSLAAVGRLVAGQRLAYEKLTPLGGGKKLPRLGLPDAPIPAEAPVPLEEPQ